jgi:hypothetical protein
LNEKWIHILGDRSKYFRVMARLVPAIHAGKPVPFPGKLQQPPGVDGRDKHGHDAESRMLGIGRSKERNRRVR